MKNISLQVVRAPRGPIFVDIKAGSSSYPPRQQGSYSYDPQDCEVFHKRAEQKVTLLFCLPKLEICQRLFPDRSTSIECRHLMVNPDLFRHTSLPINSRRCSVTLYIFFPVDNFFPGEWDAGICNPHEECAPCDPKIKGPL